jgi:hypothetical protein
MPETTAPDLLLETARRAVQRGQPERARAVLRALTTQYAGDLRVWQALADVAADEHERRMVLDQLATLTPVSLADELPEQPPPQELQLPAAVALMPYDAEHAPEPAAVRWPTYLVIGLAVVIMLLFALWRWVLVPATAVLEPTQTANNAPLPTLDASIPAATVPAEQFAPTAIPVIPATPVPPSVTPVPTIGPTATPRPSMPLGEVIQETQWNLTLLRPEDALLLDGSIGSLQPQGRFVLALLAVGNMGDLPSRIPDGLIALQDEQGHRYTPLPSASTTYLATYGRGQAGDVSYDEPIPIDAGNLSVPIIFDVPPGTRGLQLVVGKAPMGWSVSGS